mmetsp:Transcript_75933/g.245816  ORF Transcript_75933/g.245816 Transcript_75933/m.245816 type:complete len:172 (+) Transcript_75933:69-584(+)
MSFGQKFGRKTCEEWDDLTNDEIAKLKQQCQHRAACGFTSAELVVIPNHVAGDEAWCGSGKKAYVESKLNAVLGTMGFACVFVGDTGEWRYHNSTVRVSWKVVECPDNTSRESKAVCGNHVIECGVCAEQGSAQRLAPCGHLVCGKCASRSLSQCPFCRELVAEVQHIYQP